MIGQTQEKTADPRSSGGKKLLVVGVWANAVLLAAVLFMLLGGSGGRGLPEFLPSAYAQSSMGGGGPTMGGGAGVFVVPAQFGGNAFGCYLLDIDQQTLVAYQYSATDRALKLVAARSYRFDRRLQNFNTAAPTPREVEQLVQLEAKGVRGVEPSTQP